MVIYEPYNDKLVRAYSDKGMSIERDGEPYSEAIDLKEFGYAYTETDIPIETEQATEADYLQALERLGVKND